MRSRTPTQAQEWRLAGYLRDTHRAYHNWWRHHHPAQQLEIAGIDLVSTSRPPNSHGRHLDRCCVLVDKTQGIGIGIQSM